MYSVITSPQCSFVWDYTYGNPVVHGNSLSCCCPCRTTVCQSCFAAERMLTGPILGAVIENFLHEDLCRAPQGVMCQATITLAWRLLHPVLAVCLHIAEFRDHFRHDNVVAIKNQYLSSYHTMILGTAVPQLLEWQTSLITDSLIPVALILRPHFSQFSRAKNNTIGNSLISISGSLQDQLLKSHFRNHLAFNLFYFWCCNSCHLEPWELEIVNSAIY